MRRFVQLVLLLTVAAALCPAQEVVDRIVATVNRQPILLSDWDVEMRYEALVERKTLPLSDETARAALERLIDQELLRQQIRSYRLPAPTPTELDGRVRELSRQLLSREDGASFQALLARYGIGEAELRERLATQMTILRFIDVRVRPSVHVDRRSIEAYYNDKLLPEIRKKGEMPTPLADVSPLIEEVLSQERVDAMTADWLKELRQQSDIHIEPALGPQPNASVKPPEPGRR